MGPGQTPSTDQAAQHLRNRDGDPARPAVLLVDNHREHDEPQNDVDRPDPDYRRQRARFDRLLSHAQHVVLDEID